MPGAIAVMFAEPAAVPLMDTVTVVEPGANVTVSGTATLLGSLETSLACNPAAGALPPLRVRLRLPISPIAKETADEENFIVGAGTVIVRLAEIWPRANAVIVADPIPTAETVGCEAGVVDPSGTKTIFGVMATVEGSLLSRVTNTPPACAAFGNVMMGSFGISLQFPAEEARLRFRERALSGGNQVATSPDSLFHSCGNCRQCVFAEGTWSKHRLYCYV